MWVERLDLCKDNKKTKIGNTIWNTYLCKIRIFGILNKWKILFRNLFFFSSQTKNESCGGGLELEREFIKLQFGNVVLKCSCVLHSDNIEIHLLLLVFKLQFSHVVFHTEKLFCHYVVVQLHFKTTFPNCNLMNSLSSSNPQKPTRIHYDFIIVWEKKQISKKYFFKFNISLNFLMNALGYVNIDQGIH